MPIGASPPTVPIVGGKRTFLRRLRGGFPRARALIVALGAILLAVGAYVSSLGVVRDELCRDGVRWACRKLSCSQPVLLDPGVAKLKTTISNPTEYSANILNAKLQVNEGPEHLSIPLQADSGGRDLTKNCIAGSSLISSIELKSKAATTVELMPANLDCQSTSDLACGPSTLSVGMPRSCLLTLRVRDGLGSEYSLDTKFSCSGLTLEKCAQGKEQVGSAHMIVQTSLPPQGSNTTYHDLVSPTAEQVRTDVLNYFLSGGTVVAERDIWPAAPPSCKLDANRRDCSIRVEVTIQDVNNLRRCTAHFAVYRHAGKTWKLDDLTDAGGCAR